MLTARFRTTSGESSATLFSDFVEPIETPHLRMDFMRRGNRKVWCVYEHFGKVNLEIFFDGNIFENNEFTGEKSFDGIAIELVEAGGFAKLGLFRTLNSGVPIYYSVEKDFVAISWDFLAVAAAIKNPSVNVNASRRFVVHGPGVEAETILNEINLLGPGHIVVLSEGRATVKNVGSLTRHASCILSPRANATDHFLEVIAAAIKPRLQRSNSIALELSGGQDSSCVAGALARLSARGVATTYGLIHEGPAGHQQRLRRDELIERYNFSDIMVPSQRCRPLSSFTMPDLRRSYFDEIYRLGVNECLDALPTSPDLVLTGIGGDELTLVPSANTAEWVSETAKAAKILFRGEIEPGIRTPSLQASSAVQSSFSRADIFLSRRIWPCNPLCDPAVVQYCARLPESMKRGRLLNKIALSRLGLSDYFLFPRYKENFAPVYDEELRRFDLPRFMKNSLIHEYKIIDISSLMNEHLAFVNTGICSIALTIFYSAIALEQLLRQIFLSGVVAPA